MVNKLALDQQRRGRHALHPILPIHPLKTSPQPRQDFVADGVGLIAGVFYCEAGADEGGEGAGLRGTGGKFGDVNGDQVHRDAANDGRERFTDHHLSAGAAIGAVTFAQFV